MTKPVPDRARRPGALRRGWALLAALACLAGAPADAQQQPTAASAADFFRNLPPDQQRAILEQMGKGVSGNRAEAPLDFPATSQPRRDTDLEPAELDAERERVVRLRAGDTVVLDVAVRNAGDDPFPRPAPTVPAASSTDPSARATTATPPAAKRKTSEERAREARERAAAQRTEIEQRAVEELRLRLLDANPYQLDRSGSIVLPGVGSIALAGLNAEQATKRLASDPALRELRLQLTLLPLERTDVAALKPFGYDMFSALPSTFAQASDVPVPGEYVLGPGDTLQVQLLGSTRGDYSLVVGRNGEVRLPELGPVAVAGLRFDEARQMIEARVADRMIGTRAVVNIGALRSMTIFVTGEAEQPGSYTVSSLSTITNALFATGGVREIGSLRNIQLKRGGRTVTTLDLYDLLLRGDTSDDLRLQSGDVIFIPPVGPTVGVTGEIRRPAIYELKGEATAAELLHLAGGLTPEADARLATLERIGESRQRLVMDLDLSASSGRATPLRSGDLLRLRTVRPDLTNSVAVTGHLHRPVTLGWRQGLRLVDVLPSVDELKPRADLNYVLIRREALDRSVSVISADLLNAWRQPASADNVLLAPRDRILVFSLEGGRELALRPVLDDMRRQAELGAPTQIIGVGGRVKAPGQYPLETGMRLSDLVRAGGGLGEAAFGGEAELTRYEVINGEYRRTELIEIDLARAVAGDPAADVLLQPFDYLVIKELPQWNEQETVTLLGEVRFPGEYPIKRGETLRSVIDRAGGLTDLAFAEGSVFTRETLKEREAQQIERLASRLQGDLAALALQATQSGSRGGESATEAVAVGQSLLEGLRDTEPVGRLVIDLDRILASTAGAATDIVLKRGDRLLVPARAQEVTVLGEVQSGTSHVWDPNLSRDDYLGLSGGMTQKADDKRVYVVRANGSVIAGGNSRWFRNDGVEMRPGDTIVVPLDAERMRPLALWSAVTTIIYNLAIAVAAVNSF